MASKGRKFAIKACAAAAGCALGFGASAQSLNQSVEQVQASLNRGIKLPLEIIWLQSEIQADMWRNPAMAGALQGCSRTGAPKEGCAVSVRNSWRYSFDANSAVRPTPIVVSSLNIPNAPFANGRLNLSGSGRVFLVTSAADSSGGIIRPPQGVILLAAGSTVQLVDAAYPSIQIEVKAPENQPLFLGNLAAAEIGKVFALLMQPSIVSASAADVLQDGKVAFRSGGSAAPGTQLAAAPTVLETAPRPESFTVASVDLSAVSGSLETPASALEKAVRIQPAVELPVRELAKPIAAEPAIVLTQDFSLLAGVVESPTLLPVRAEPFTVASVDLSALTGRLDVPAAERAKAVEAPVQIASLQQLDLSRVESASAVALPAPKAEAPVKVAEKAPIQLAMASPVVAAPVAAAPSLAVPLPTAATPAPASSSAEIAKMRAEVEAEIAREQQRLAQMMQGKAGKQFRFGT